MVIFISIVVGLILLYLLLTYIMFSLMCKNKKTTKLPMTEGVFKALEPYKKVIDKGKEWVINKYNNNQVKDVFILSKDGLKLHAIFIKNDNSKGILLEVHGYKSMPENDLYASCFEYYNMGYSLLLPDARTCNKSEGKYITFGVKESDDIISWVEYLNHEFPNKNIVLAGISMGATSVLLALKKITKSMNIKCAIADCGYVSAYDEILYCIKYFFHLNGKLFIDMINVWCKLLAKFNLKDANTLRLSNKMKVPILFIHGLDDDFVLCENTNINYQNYDGPKEIVLFDNASHGISYLVDSKKYIKWIKKMIFNN